MEITLRPWSDSDLPVLERANTPVMTQYLGGPETPGQVRDRHEKYLRLWREDASWMYVIQIEDDAVGSIGYWPVEYDGIDAYGSGWAVDLAWQGRGIARHALSLLIERVIADGDRDLLVAEPGIDNAASNALCRGAGFTLSRSETEPWRGGELTYNVWLLDIGRLRGQSSAQG